jgi:hypothetical protein
MLKACFYGMLNGGGSSRESLARHVQAKTYPGLTPEILNTFLDAAQVHPYITALTEFNQSTQQIGAEL